MNVRSRYCIVLGFCALFITAQAQAAQVSTAVVVAVVPNAPSDLTANPDAPTQVTLSWTNNSNGTEDGFSVERKTGVGGIYSVIGTTGSGVATYVDDSVVPATTYFYRVQAFIGSGFSSYSNEASVTTPSLPVSGGGGESGGGGGGGGSGYVPPVQGSAIFKGIAYPASNVTLLQNGQSVAVTQAGPDANFEIDLSGIAPGTYSFALWASDPDGNRSVIQTFTVTLTNGATTIISGIFFAPTISVDKTEVKQGDPLTVIGYTAPQATVSVVVNSAKEIIGSVTSTNNGAWVYQVNTNLLEYGSHTVHANAEASSGALTENSDFEAFTVGDQDVQAPSSSPSFPASVDLNGDGKIDITDFSILAYWYKRPDPPGALLLDHAPVVDLTDFSILAYYWTG